MNAIPVARGCGTRVSGGLYWETGLGPGGRPVEDFLFDPPGALTPERIRDLGIRPIGVSLTPPGPDGVVHVLDWVGSRHYPNVADLVEEVRRFGLSRRLPRTLDFARLSRQSRIVLLHANAVILGPEPYWAGQQRTAGHAWCPKTVPDHMTALPGFRSGGEPPSHCAGLWWEDVAGGDLDLEGLSNGYDERAVVRRMPAFDYRARKAPEGADGRYLPGLFASFPCSRIVAIRDPDGDAHERALRAAEPAARNGLRVALEDC